MKITEKEIEITIGEMVDLQALPPPLYYWIVKCLEKITKVKLVK